MRQVGDSLEKHVDKTLDDASQMSAEEISKLNRFEYRVVDIEEGSAAENEQFLTMLGNEGWECFSTERLDFVQKQRFYCKRRPATYLRYLPRWFP
jgi:hypothetical protein